jgi:molecular chaperone DnaK
MESQSMKSTQAVGIDLGTTYSCIACLNEHGQPVTIPNQEGELATPSVVFFDDEQPIVGTEALRNSIAHPDRVVQHAKRYMGDARKTWQIGGTHYSPFHISGMIIRKLVSAAQEKIGEIREAVITVPAQFSDAQRHATILAGHAAGLEKIEMINEPVAAALCHVLGNEGLAFTELAVDQQLLVYDLGGGTLDLAVVRYRENEVRVIAADGDLQLGGLDWTQVLVDIAAENFIADFGEDPRKDRESLQFLSLEAEQAKRSLSVRPRAAVTVQHGSHRRTYQIELTEFESRSKALVARSETVTRRILSANKMGWAHIDVVLTTGGASRMPMVRDSLKKLGGRTLNTSLSPDQSIAHGAAYYAGMLLANQQYARTVFDSEASSRLRQLTQQSVSARDLGILIRDVETGRRIPHYLIPANSPLPVSQSHVFGTVVANQNRVHVQIVESGAGPGLPPTILGACRITQLPPRLPEGSEVEVTISYDRQARVHVAAREVVSGTLAEVEIVRFENLEAQLEQLPINDELAPTFPAGSSGAGPDGR